MLHLNLLKRSAVALFAPWAGTAASQQLLGLRSATTGTRQPETVRWKLKSIVVFPQWMRQEGFRPYEDGRPSISQAVEWQLDGRHLPRMQDALDVIKPMVKK